MVKVCSYTYPKVEEGQYQSYYDKYPYPLHDFQKWCVEAIVGGNHVLACCPTGSGKTFGGEFALDYFFSKGKKTIYCSPIKALSNQKFYDFTRKYPHISVGLITGDIKTNPDAQVLIMTTEILLNKLYQINSTTAPTSSVSFDMNIETELGCVVFDETHMINDASRGHVWEQSIMLLPKHVQIVGLSATLDNPEKFAYWLETKGESPKSDDKIVYLTRKQERAVPLIHYSFISTVASVPKLIKDKAVQEEISNMTNKPVIIQSAKGEFNSNHSYRVNKILKLFEEKDIRIKRQHVLIKLAEYLVQNEMLPALCYVFSRKQLEKCAQEMTANLLEFDSKVPYTIDRECEQIIRKLPNYQEYLHLPEYVNMVTLLRKGVGIHHAGLMPVLREMVELLFAKGYIKILFCTETMSVGINLPVKTTIFTDVCKFDGTASRMLYGHEYTQAAGRAGRLGLDTVGHVIHLNNLFRDINGSEYMSMLKGSPQTLCSKFKVSYNLLLNLIETGDKNIIGFSKRSMVTNEIDSQLGEIHGAINKLTNEMDTIEMYNRTPVDVVERYLDLCSRRHSAVNKKRKDIDREIQSIQNEYKYLENDKIVVEKFIKKRKELTMLHNQFDSTQRYIGSQVDVVMKLLITEGFVTNQQPPKQKHVDNKSILDELEVKFGRLTYNKEHGDWTDQDGFVRYIQDDTARDDNNSEENNEQNNEQYSEKNSSNICLTQMGVFAANLREVHCLVFAKLFASGEIYNLTSMQLVSLLSCFTNITVADDYKSSVPMADDKTTQNIILKVAEMYTYYQSKEQFDTGVEYDIHYDLINYVTKWCKCENEIECKLVLQQMGTEKEIFLGEFVKALLKITNISCEMEKIAEITGNISFLSRLKEIPGMILKFVVTNQSLYV